MNKSDLICRCGHKRGSHTIKGEVPRDGTIGYAIVEKFGGWCFYCGYETFKLDNLSFLEMKYNESESKSYGKQDVDVPRCTN